MSGRRRADSDEGFTLMELVVASMLGIIVLLIVGSLLINGLRGQSSVTSITNATNDSQLAASTIQGDIRNATAVKTTSIGSDQFVVARVARGTNTVVTYECVAWYYSASNDEIRSRESSTAITAPTAGALADWRLVASKITPKGSTVFSAADLKSLSITFFVDAGTTDSVPISTFAASRNPTGDSAPCF
jgi:Tfp pilus assembly protein PilW